MNEFWEEHNARLNRIIGKMSVVIMQTRNPLATECHGELIDLATWVDEQMESLTANDS